MREMCFPGGRKKALTLSYDDGVEQDIRLIDIMARYGLKGTFNLNSGAYASEGQVWPQGQIHRRLSKSAATRLYGASGQEIAAHAWRHPDLTALTPAEMTRQIMRDKEELEDQFGRIVRGLAYPYGAFNDQAAGALRACGIDYARTVISTGKFSLPEDWLRLPATCHHNDSRLMELARQFLEAPDTGRPALFYLWGHSYEFEAQDNWRVIEDFAACLGNRKDIWYATNIEVYDYVHSYRCLRASADGTMLENPTALTLWVRCGSGTTAIAPGETVKLPQD